MLPRKITVVVSAAPASSDLAASVRRTIRCRASSPGPSVTSPHLLICATVWLAAEWVTPVARAMSRMELGPRATTARTTGLNRGR